MTSEVKVLLIAVLSLVLALVGHVAMAFILDISALGMVSAAIPFVLILLCVIAVKSAATHDRQGH